MRRRHFGVLISFMLMVLLPVVVSSWYLWVRAADQYASTLGFSVHRESTSSAIGLLTGLSSLSGSSSSDTDIIYKYLYSQQLVGEIDSEIDLRAIWSRPDGDPVYRFNPDGTIEDLVDYWNDMVNVYYDSSTRLIEVRVLAFSPEEAQLIAKVIFEKSTTMINRLNDIASEDALRYANDELKKTREDVILARQEMTTFRNKYQFVDPTADVATQSSIVASLMGQLAEAMIDLDVLKDRAISSDPRIEPLERRIRVISERIDAERAKLGGNTDGEVLSNIMSDYERLVADRQFAETAYQAARANYEVAQAETRRQSRYLAAHVMPTLAESSRFPKRITQLAVIGVFLAMLWSIGVLIYYSMRDRR
ncbi:MAG: capsule biosynthesis protein [Rhodobacter sp.]|nr:capsule biosynthesis protein [Rhodobacter sp.]